MGALGSLDSCVMDDPLTPLYVSAGNSFDQEFHQQDFLLPPPNNEHYSKITSNTKEGTAGTLTTNHQGDDLELPDDMLELLEKVPLDIEQFASEGCNLLPLDCYTSQPFSDPVLESIIESIPSNQLATTQQTLTEQQDEAAIMDFEELVSFVDLGVPEDQKADNNLQLDIKLATSNPAEQAVVTTPDLIKLLLENEALAEKEPDDPKMVQDVKVEPVESPKPGPSRQRSSKSNQSKTCDLRRVRNNIASRKSRENRRNKLMKQKHMVDELEVGNKRLELKIKQLESLRDQLMAYVTRR